MSHIFNFRILVLLSLFSIAIIFSPVEVTAADDSSQNPEVQKHIDKGIQFGKEGDFEKAIAAFKEVLKLDPKNVHAYNNNHVHGETVTLEPLASAVW